MEIVSRFRAVLIVAMLAVLFGNMSAQAGEPSNAAALDGFRDARAIFDVNVAEPEKLTLYLSVIEETRAELSRRGLAPDFIVAFRGPSVKLVTGDVAGFDGGEQKILKQIAEQIAKLAEAGTRFEACAIAAGLFGVDKAKVLPGVDVVGNTFISLIGYQRKGYALVPIL